MRPSGVNSGLTHRGGLRAQILTEGVIRVGDPITAAYSTFEHRVRIMSTVIDDRRFVIDDE
ncbi:MAG: hypothetical protein L0Y44_04995 [Phycisphaerales bacterium]|nr:hypothetical protein [Phycisphaerales bacterium]